MSQSPPAHPLCCSQSHIHHPFHHHLNPSTLRSLPPLLGCGLGKPGNCRMCESLCFPTLLCRCRITTVWLCSIPTLSSPGAAKLRFAGPSESSRPPHREQSGLQAFPAEYYTCFSLISFGRTKCVMSSPSTEGNYFSISLPCRPETENGNHF